ncbi:MAG: pyridoxamine 5'-phosphate oxidase family protein [Candidatus Bathyarchaeia archaeon]
MEKYHLRRSDKEIKDLDQIKKIIKTAQFMTISMAVENQPYLVSLTHAYDEERGCLYFHCAPEGKKIEYLKRNNLVWGEILLDYGYSQGECTHLYASVHFSGRVRFVEDPEERKRAFELMIKRLDKEPDNLIPKMREMISSVNVLIGRIDTNYISGKKSREINI